MHCALSLRALLSPDHAAHRSTALGVDARVHPQAFLYLDNATYARASGGSSLDTWVRAGWVVKQVPLSAPTEIVSANRLTTKRLKFDPPDEELVGRDCE